MSVAAFSIRRPVTTIMCFVSLVVVGLIAAFRLPLEALPDISAPFLFVQLPYTGSTPDEVERNLVRPAEEALATMTGIKRGGVRPVGGKSWQLLRGRMAGRSVDRRHPRIGRVSAWRRGGSADRLGAAEADLSMGFVYIENPSVARHRQKGREERGRSQVHVGRGQRQRVQNGAVGIGRAQPVARLPKEILQPVLHGGVVRGG